MKPLHALQALDRAKPGPVEEGAVGGGTGMGCNGFKGGIGTSSHIADRTGKAAYTLGVLVQCNYGGDLRILGVPIRPEITDLRHVHRAARSRCPGRGRADARPCAADRRLPDERDRPTRDTNAAARSSSSSRPTRRCCRTNSSASRRRVGMGLGRLGSWAGNSSGDLFLAFSTANRRRRRIRRARRR